MREIIDKKNLLSNLTEGYGADLELGCGNRKLRSNSIGIDLLNTNSVDLVGDIFHVLSKFPNNSAKLITSHHFIEHIDDFFGMMKELERILEPGGIIDFTAPHFSNPYFYSDITHRRFFGLYTFCYISNNSPFKRKVPNYDNVLKYQILSVELCFKTDTVFPVRYILKRAIGIIFNCCTYMQELYEDCFSGAFSCYEIRYRLRKMD